MHSPNRSSPTSSSSGRSTRGEPPRQARTLADALGWASLGLGVPQVVAPGRFARFLGIRDDAKTRLWTRIVGVRELIAAADILALERPRPVRGLWARVAGDVKDLALLVDSLGKSEQPARTVAAIGGVVGIGAADLYAATSMSPASEEPAEHRPTRVRAAITVKRARGDVYRFWHDFQNLPRFMGHLESVQTSNGHSHWKATAPIGRTVEWDAEIVDDRPDELIAWRSVGGDVQHSGTVRFSDAPGDRGTEIRLDMTYKPPGGPVGVAVAKLVGEEPRQQVRDDLRRFKQVLEVGHVVRSEGTPEGPMTRRLLLQRPARPIEEART
jgi:uncharacterized membrane protein